GRQGPRHAARDGAARARPARSRGSAHPRCAGEQRGPRLGRPLLLQPLLRHLLRPARGARGVGATRMSGPVAADERPDRLVLRTLQTLLIGLTLLVGGVHPSTSTVACPVVFALLAVTIRQRRRRGGGPLAPGLPALAAFIALALLTTVPLPPWILHWLSPRTVELYAPMLPGWPGAGGWPVLRPLPTAPHRPLPHVPRPSPPLHPF